jgi:hypothetical protein
MPSRSGALMDGESAVVAAGWAPATAAIRTSRAALGAAILPREGLARRSGPGRPGGGCAACSSIGEDWDEGRQRRWRYC